MQTPAVNLEVGECYAVVYDHTGPSIGFVGELLERWLVSTVAWSIFRELRGLSEDAPPFRIFDDRLLSAVRVDGPRLTPDEERSLGVDPSPW